MTDLPGVTPAAAAPLDSLVHAAIGRFTGGLSPTALGTAWLDWSMHLLGSPAKQADLARLGATGAVDAWTAPWRHLAGHRGAPREPGDTRFADAEWDRFPFSMLSHWFLLQDAWWDAATSGLHGVEPAHERIVRFMARQTLDMMSPANFALTNPKVLRRTREERGENLLRGAALWLEDLNQLLTGRERQHPGFRVGETLATTQGDVVFRNRLIKLIRYRPRTGAVRPEPVLIVPAWIMKYYILDLSPGNSLIRFLLDQGFEVYAISWKNPAAEDAELSFLDYLDLGFRAALDVVAAKPDDRVHAAGYCLGGTLLAIAAAAMARDGDERLATISFLATQVDFSEAGELSLFIGESQVAFLEDIMATQGYLRADQMAGAFKLLRSNDLIWSRVIRHYLLGERTEMNDLMAWNADATRMPARMHADYLRGLFLENRLARGRFEVDGRPVALPDIRAPIFSLATEADHVAPWRSVYKLGVLTDTDVTFCLTSGGHNGGVLSEPGHAHRHHRIGRRVEGDLHVPAEHWVAGTPEVAGSWWPAWAAWLAGRSGATRPAAPCPHPSLGPAPGTYVHG